MPREKHDETIMMAKTRGNTIEPVSLFLSFFFFVLRSSNEEEEEGEGENDGTREMSITNPT